MSCSRLLVASWVVAMFTALSSVEVSSCSRSFDCTCGLFDPKIRASIMRSSGFAYLHSFVQLLLYGAKFVSGESEITCEFLLISC